MLGLKEFYLLKRVFFTCVTHYSIFQNSINLDEQSFRRILKLDNFNRL
jgi:hypothetical protein